MKSLKAPSFYHANADAGVANLTIISNRYFFREVEEVIKSLKASKHDTLVVISEVNEVLRVTRGHVILNNFRTFIIHGDV